MNATSRILLPFNFTDGCVSALRYASQLAAYLKADLVLLYCSGEKQLTPTFQSDVLARLRSFTDRYMVSTGRSLTRFCVVRAGSLLENLPSVIRNHNVQLTVAGADALVSSVPVKEVVSLASFEACPVLLVPAEAVFKPLKEIVFSLDVMDVDATVLQQVQQLAQQFEARLTLLHLYGNMDALTHCLLEKAASKLQQELTYTNVSIVCQEEDDLVEGFNDFAELYTPDLFVLATRDTHLLQEYFSGPYRKTSAYHLHTPLLNLYQERKTACSGSCQHCKTRHMPNTTNTTAQHLETVN